MAPVSSAEYYARMALFVLLNVWSAVGVIAWSLPVLPLRFVRVPSVHAFQSQVRQVQAAYISFLLMLTAVCMPGSRLIVTGDWDRMKSSAKQVILSNHQIYPDWFFLFIFARFRQCHADVKVILINILSRLPLFGQGMWFFEFIFMKQRFDKDKVNMAHHLLTSKRDPHPLWLLIFPEGTLNTPGNIEKSKAYAKKVCKHHCILPKSTGLFFCLDTLYPCVQDLFDLTVGYSGLDGTQVPYDRYLVDRVFFGREYPREIHIHVQRVDPEKLPGFTVDDGVDARRRQEEVQETADAKTRFEEWLRGVWFAKDERMARFYKSGSMVDPISEAEVASRKKEILISPLWEDWISVIILFAGGFWLPRLYISAVTLLVGWAVSK
ncbi:hypothetical protein HDU83_003422 [Entophlyctis luteolus]|nr:hypothetical protein HDU83_003422 [Entophlyctis luteolus]